MTKKAKKPEYKRCALSHPDVRIEGSDGKILTFRGGSKYAVPFDADVVVHLDTYVEVSPMAYPWVQGIEFIYPINDQCAPSDPHTFHELIDYLIAEARSGGRVFICCIGGHGRTGTVLSALHATLTGRTDSIKWIRANYCDRAVESSEQVNFLHKYFGCEKVQGSRTILAKASGKADYFKESLDPPWQRPAKHHDEGTLAPKSVKDLFSNEDDEDDEDGEGADLLTNDADLVSVYHDEESPMRIGRIRDY